MAYFKVDTAKLSPELKKKLKDYFLQNGCNLSHGLVNNVPSAQAIREIAKEGGFLVEILPPT